METPLVDAIQMLYLRYKAEQLGFEKKRELERPLPDREGAEWDIRVKIAVMDCEWELTVEQRDKLWAVARKAAGLTH